METKIKFLPKSQVELIIELSSDEMERYYDSACRSISQRSQIKGFRPGFAPKDMVIREAGKEKVNQIAMDLAIKENLAKAITEHNLEVIGDPKVSQPNSNENPVGNLVFKAEFAVLPKIALGDYKKISVSLGEIKVEIKEVESVLENIRKSRAQNIAANRPAQKGDRLEIDFTAKVAGVVIDGGESKQHPLVLGEGHFMAGFEQELIGMKENETKMFSIKVPADYSQAELAGKTADFDVKINLVQARILPELNDEFAKSLGNFGSVEELRKNVEEGLKMEKEVKAKDERRAKIALALTKDLAVDLPEQLVEFELNKMIAELADSLGKMNLTIDSYLAHMRKSFDDLKKDWRSQAEQRIKVALALRDIAIKENLTASDEEIETKLSQFLRNTPPLRHGQNLDLTSLRGYVKGLIRNEKVFELLENKI